MRTARLMGLSQDGQTLMVVTDTGEELAIAADDRLRAALRGDRPRLGQLEIEMDSALRPRDIQSRIRSGESLDDVARAAGLPLDRVERFAAPVLAEREHVARLAVAASVRRRGETSGHRTLRVALTERLASRGVDVDDVEWDSYRREDGRWAVAGTYRSGDSDREVLFLYDLRGRFSVAANEEARWVLGEHIAPKAVPSGRRGTTSGEPDTEPTVDLSDELALVRAVQEPVRAAADLLHSTDNDAVALHPRDSDYDDAEVSELFDDADLPGAVQDRMAEDQDSEHEEPEREVSGLQDRGSQDAAAGPGAEHPGYEISHRTWEEEVEESLEEEAAAEHSPLDTLYGMLGGEGQAEDPPRVHRGLTDASAVPETDNVGWEPAIVVDYPVEPSASDDDAPQERPTPGTPHRQAPVDETTHTLLGTHTTPVADPEAPAKDLQDHQDDQDDPQPALVPDPDATDTPTSARKSAKRKRASVPSWDEIMFGGPKRL